MKKRLPCLGAMLIFLISSLCAEDAHHHFDPKPEAGNGFVSYFVRQFRSEVL